MLKFNFRREKDQDFKHIAPGLIPAASLAPKPAVPRTPPPRSPNPSPERPRSALAAAIFSSSLTGQTWAIPPVRARSFSESDLSDSFIPEPNSSTPLITRDRWSQDLADRPRLSSPEPSEEELEDRDEGVQAEEDREERVYQTLNRQENNSDTEPVYAVSRKPKTSTTQPAQMSEGRSPPSGSRAELHNLRRHAQELVDENDALKMTVHRLSVELSQYQTCFRPLTKQESSRISGLPRTGSPPPWLLDMKHLSPLLLAYEDRMKEKDALLQVTEVEVKRLRVHVEEVIKENERLHDEIAKTAGFSQEDCRQIQQQAFLVLQENQALMDQLKAQHVEAKASHSGYRTEVSKVYKQLMLLEAEKQRLQQDLEESRGELQKNVREVQVLQARLKDSLNLDCNNSGKLKRQLEQQESRNKSEMEELLLKLSSLQEENRRLALDKAHLSADVKKVEADLELTKQVKRKAERRMSLLKQQKEECVMKEENTRHYMGAVISVAEHVSQERDRLLQMTLMLQKEKQRFIGRILKGTVRFEKLQEDVKVYRRKASTRLAVLKEAAEGRTASYQREIRHLQRLLGERQEAEERLLQSKREMEEELEVVWQAASRENQRMRETLLDSTLAANLYSPDEATASNQQQAQSSDPVLFDSHQSPGIYKRVVFTSNADFQNSSSEEKQKHGLDFYC